MMSNGSALIKLLLTHIVAVALGAAYVWVFSPSDQITPVMGAVFALIGCTVSYWWLVEGK